MASYHSSFDPPPRPERGPRGQQKPSTYIQPSSSNSLGANPIRRGQKEDDVAHISGRMDPLHGPGKSYGRQTSLPKPTMRNAPADNLARTKAIPGFGFRRPPAPVSSTSSGHQAMTPNDSRNVLRRKPSSIAQNATSPEPESQIHESMSPVSWSSPFSSNDRTIQKTLGLEHTIDYDHRQPTVPNVETSAPIIPELDRYRSVGDSRKHPSTKFVADMPYKLATQDLPPPTPLNSAMSGHSRYSGYSGNSGYSAHSAYSVSPSTRFSESPGPGAYSRDTTPTSMSSQSPSVAAPLRMTPRLRQNSPINSRPPLTRRRAGSVPNEAESAGLDVHGLPSLRESLTSSSSNSTVKDSEKAAGTPKEKRKKRLSPMPPSPPPRKSSQKFKKSASEDQQVSPSKASRTPARPVMGAPASTSTLKTTNVKTARQATKHIPPARPSREGTPNLEAQFEESRAVIQSNLTGIHFSSERRQSAIALPSAQQASSQTEASPRPSLSRLPSRNYPPSPVQQGPSVPSGLGIIPDLRPVVNQTHSERQIPASRTPSPSVAAPKHRFGLFGRRNKTESEVTKAPQKETTMRKGPTAGTGHEGYGRYAMRGRSGSAGGGRDRSYSGASSSQESVSSTRTHDPFLLERMSPVIITGGGDIIQNRNESLELTRSESSHSLPTRPSIESKTSISQTSARSNLSKEVSRTTLWPSAMPRFAPSASSTSLASKGAYTSESSDNENNRQKPSLAVRRSMNRLQSADQEPLRLPKPIKISDGGSSPASSSKATSFRSDDIRYEASHLSGSKKDQGTGPKKLLKRPRSPRKWNFFQRSQPSANKKKQPETVLPVVVASAPAKAVPYYAMMDSSEQEDDAPMDMEEILREADVLDLAQLRGESPASRTNAGRATPQEDSRRPSVTSQPLSSAEISPLTTTNVQEPLIAEVIESSVAKTEGQTQPPVRPSRLLQVGRIPRVVTARPEQTSPKSFSRPFARVSMTQPLPNLLVVDRQSIAVGPSPERSPSPRSRNGKGATDPSIETRQPESSDQQKPFLVISPRKGSAATTSSSSGAMSFAGTTAIVPDADAALEEDEVWNEYDDLIGNEETKIPESATSSHGVPFQYESFQTRATKSDKEPHKDSTVATIPIVMENSSSGAVRRLELTSSSVYSPDLGMTIKNALHGLPSPATPMSFTDFISGYGDRNNSIIMGSGGARRLSSPLGQRHSRPLSAHSKSGSTNERTRLSSDSKLMTISEQTYESPIAQVNLRVGSMTVSKWLTFGHVLFSPAREAVLQTEDPAKHQSILVVDGLGNDDWAFYAAETYPSATFYNLSPTPSNDGKQSRSASFPQAPSNHRQVQYSSNLEKFPFPRDTFAVVVLRFPPASSDTAFRNLISESKRVLKPGGYLEMSILDLDMMNMGNRTRRAVRSLKVSLSAADPTINLASAADTVLRIVGKRGFHDIKSCKVGVPVASTVTAGSKPGGNPDVDEKDISLADMMKDESSVGDAGITKMVAKVGRWWYLRCYELVVLPDGDTSRSILADGTLLKECEKWNTSFKLLVCHAQKPVVPRRRTASV